MRRIGITLLIFLLGILTPFVIHYKFNSSKRSESNASKEIEPLKTRAKLSTSSDETIVDSRLPSSPSKSGELSVSEYRSIFSRSLATGTIDSLQVLRPEFLATLPEPDVLLPEIKGMLIDALLTKLNRKDWEQWSTVKHHVERKPPAAQTFVDDVRTVNPAIGKYLETAALLFNMLYQGTSLGQPCILSEAMAALRANAGTIFQNRIPSARAPDEMLDGQILSDPTFLRIFEELRAKLVGAYLQTPNIQVDQALALILSVSPAANESTFSPSLNAFFNNLALRATPAARSQVLVHASAVKQLEEFAKRNSSVARALGNLLAMYTVDKLDQNDPATALTAFHHAEALGISSELKQLIAHSLNLGREPRQQNHTQAPARPTGRTTSHSDLLPKETHKNITQTKSRRELFADVDVKQSDQLPETESAQVPKQSSGIGWVLFAIFGIFSLIAFAAYGFYRYKQRQMELEFHNKHDEDFTLGEQEALEPAPGETSAPDNSFNVNGFDENELQDVDLTG